MTQHELLLDDDTPTPQPEPVDRNVVKCRNCGQLLEDVQPGPSYTLPNGQTRVMIEGWCRRIPCLELRWEFTWTVGQPNKETT